MFIRFSERLRNEDKGFTLIELMVVVLIIAILIAIAIPTFLGARRRAQNRAAQSNLRNALTSEKTYYAEPQQFTQDATALNAIEPNLTFLTAGTAQAKNNEVSVGVNNTTSGQERVWLMSQSASGVYYCLAEVAHLGSYYKSHATTNCFGDITGTPDGTWFKTAGAGWSAS